MPSSWIITRDTNKKLHAAFNEIAPDRLVDGHIRIRINYSGINYKDAIALCEKPGIIRKFPCVPGIDGAGEIIESKSDKFTIGQQVFITGWGYGEEHDGHLRQESIVSEKHALHIPEDWDARSICCLGTAGFTAMQGLDALERNGISSEQGPIIISGASGGVGQIAARICKAVGFEVHAITSRPNDANIQNVLDECGVDEIHSNIDICAGAGNALEKSRWAGGIDCTGGEPLAAILRQCQPYGAVASCGVAAGSDLPVTSFPFVLRGVSLLGLSSVYYPQDKREKLWQRLCHLLHAKDLTATEHPLKDAQKVAQDILHQKHVGRQIIQVNDR